MALYDRVAYVSGVIWIIYRADVQLSSAWITEDYFKLYYVFTFIRKKKKSNLIILNFSRDLLSFFKKHFLSNWDKKILLYLSFAEMLFLGG